MTVIARFDGKVFVPEGAVDLPVGRRVSITVLPEVEDSEEDDDLLAQLEKMPDNPNWPPDGAAQLDHYLYGTPKRP